MQAAGAWFKGEVRSWERGSSHGRALLRQSKMLIAMIERARFLREQ
ncbi:hypothetical protein [Nevskia sp.]|nr:hypothetical protein [Nevskia sp.]